MDKAIFEFNIVKYSERERVESFSREKCENLCNIDVDNVTKFDLEDYPLQAILNDAVLDIDNKYYRVFI